MKSKIVIFIVTLFLSVCSLSVNAQTTIPKGKAQLIEFTNATSKFTVPAGKTWYIINVFTDYKIDLKYDAAGNKTQGLNLDVFVKSLNRTILTDLANNKLGPIINDKTIILPENSEIEFLITSGYWASEPLKQCNAKAYLNLIEVDN